MSVASELRLQVEGEPGRVGLPVFASVLGSAQTILRDIERGISHGKPEIAWVVSDLGANATLDTVVSSRLARADADPNRPQTVTRGFVAGLRTIESGGSLPPFFSETGLGALQELGNALARRHVGARALCATVLETSDSARFTKTGKENVARLRAPAVEAIGSIIGALDAISVHGAAPKYMVYDAVTRRAVKCEFTSDGLEMVKRALGARVQVSGTVVRNAKGDPLRVDNADFEILPGDDDLPTVEDIYGLVPDLTGDLSTQDYLTTIRGT